MRFHYVKGRKEAARNRGQNGVAPRKLSLTECASHRADNNEFNLLRYWYFGLEIVGKFVTLLTEAEIAQRRVMKLIILCFTQSCAVRSGETGGLMSDI